MFRFGVSSADEFIVFFSFLFHLFLVYGVPTIPSARQYPSYGDCLEVKRE